MLYLYERFVIFNIVIVLLECLSERMDRSDSFSITFAIDVKYGIVFAAHAESKPQCLT